MIEQGESPTIDGNLEEPLIKDKNIVIIINTPRFLNI